MGSGKAGGGEHGSAKREWEREDGVLPLDHFQGDAKVAEKGHGKIVRQLRFTVATISTGLEAALPKGICRLDTPRLRRTNDRHRDRGDVHHSSRNMRRSRTDKESSGNWKGRLRSLIGLVVRNYQHF